MTSFRKPQQIKQGLKILCYGEDGTGKSLTGLAFPNIAIVDTESKLGVYENNPKFNKNIKAIADTANYYDVISLTEQVLKAPSTFSTMMYDSETNMYESMQVAMMELEETRAKKKGGDVNDQTVSQRGWGKVKLNNARLKNLKCQLSAKGITIISVAHKEDIMKEVGGKQIKDGEKPALRKNSKHDYDVVLRFFKERDLGSGQLRFMCEVEKDTTGSFNIGEIVDTTWASKDQPNNIIYDRLKGYLAIMENGTTTNANYDKSISDTIKAGESEELVPFNELLESFTSTYKELLAKDPSNKAVIQSLLKEYNVDSYKEAKYYDEMFIIVGKMKGMLVPEGESKVA